MVSGRLPSMFPVIARAVILMTFPFQFMGVFSVCDEFNYQIEENFIVLQPVGGP